MEPYVLHFNEINRTHLPLVGGKGANLGELAGAGFPVPQGFCITTSAYRKLIGSSTEMEALFIRLEQLPPDDLEQLRLLAGQIRDHLIALPMPKDIEIAILDAWQASGKDIPYAVRSSATAEDLPNASFAGQQETFLNIIGEKELLSAVQHCWASLFTDRAISYRAKNGFGHRSVYLSVVIQEMMFPEVSGILFTADPISGHRHTISIDASFGLGEALVSGLVSADLYQVRDNQIIRKQIAKKELAIYALPKGGTITKSIPEAFQEIQALPNHKIIKLAEIGQHIENHYGAEQDIEWGMVNGEFVVLQSRPITSLYPLPITEDEQFRVFLNFGYIQMMTDPMMPLSLSLLSNVTGFINKGTVAPEKRVLREAGGRAFADFTRVLSLPPLRNRFLKLMGGMDELLASALTEAISRPEFRQVHIPPKTVALRIRRIAPMAIPVAFKAAANFWLKDPAKANSKATEFMNQTVRAAGLNLQQVSGAERIRFIQQGMERMFPDVLSKIIPYVITGMLASGALTKKLNQKFGDEQSAVLFSKLYKSLPGNVTTEMGLQLGDLADFARDKPELVNHLETASHETFYNGLLNVSGGPEFQQRLDHFLLQYGARCIGEIDIAKPRWHEDPAQLLPSIASNLRTMQHGEHRQRFEQGKREAEAAEKEILRHFTGIEKRYVRRLIRLYRHLLGMREHHKFALVKGMDLYKLAILEEAQTLVGKGKLLTVQDVFYLSVEELSGLLYGQHSGNLQEAIESRKQQHEANGKLKTPRVMTSDGEIIEGKPRTGSGLKDALMGTPVSSGSVTGIARVILRSENARLNAGDILIAPYTDPGWTPLFTSAAGLVTEVGGMMTHGSVVAREYGIPAVVGVVGATQLIQDGDRIRVDGTQGFVQILQRKMEISR
ncbi:phosphoenolpyruvate synthase [Planomicrobium chinense]|uniref:phosphoenolpyruvate synthase n=1 Tax=Planococcus chinensis TaxID=272917 RepID=UPI001CC6B5E0|nr:phosphoenolpyruvate synthase [Planococcus chinensis]MBZ5200521.1 phosphoenolpyruvate synthase [Planococcus chinensis]